MHDELLPECGRIRSELAGLVYGELAPDTRSTIEAHLEACGACREEHSALRETSRLLSRWETPAGGEDPVALARTIAARARLGSARAPRRPRLVRWSAILLGAAAALLFTLSLAQASLRYDDGRFDLSFALPGASATPVSIQSESLQPEMVAQTMQAGMRDEVRALVAQEFAVHTAGFEANQEELFRRVSVMTQQELLRLSRAIDLALLQNQQKYDSRIASLGREAAKADLETRRVVTDLAGYLPVSQSNR